MNFSNILDLPSDLLCSSDTEPRVLCYKHVRDGIDLAVQEASKKGIEEVIISFTRTGYRQKARVIVKQPELELLESLNIFITYKKKNSENQFESFRDIKIGELVPGWRTSRLTGNNTGTSFADLKSVGQIGNELSKLVDKHLESSVK